MLSEDLRDELAQIAPRRRCCRLAELSALFHASGSWHLRGGAVAVHLDLAASAAARRAFALLRDLGVRSEIRTYRRRAFDQATRYQLHVDVDAPCTRRAARGRRALARRERRSSTRRSASSADRAAAGPTFAAPSSARGRSRAHATLISSCARAAIDGARFIAEVAAREEVKLAVAERRSHAVAYAKGHEAIGDLLALAGAGETALRLEEHAVVAATRARANRLANADEANLVRTARAAHEQLEAIRALDIASLPPRLAEIAELRLRHPSASLRELAAKARPPITKAAAHRRLRALVRSVET